MIKRSIKILLLLFLLVISLSSNSQDLPKDLSKVKSYQISDDMLKKYIAQAEAAGLSYNEVENEIKSRGLPDSELSILRERIKVLMLVSNNKPEKQNKLQNGVERELNDTLIEENPQKVSSGKPASAKLFGSDLFASTNKTFEPNLKIPTPLNYILGPTDVLNITFSGVNDAQQTATVNLEGNVNLKYVGPINVNGLTIEDAKRRILTKYRKVYPSLLSGKTQMQLTLGSIRSIKVTIIGSVIKSGTYTLPSLATVYNALYASGGPDDYGSFREIELIRRNKVIQKIDIYNYLLFGDQSQDMHLEDRDVIRIPIAKTRVLIDGEVKRVGVFEMLPGENFSKLLQFSGGFKRSAYKAKVKGERITQKEKAIIHVFSANFDTFEPIDGDSYNVDKVLDRYENAVKISGAVFRPGVYPYDSTMHISDLIQRADGFREDVYTNRGLLYRFREDRTKEMTSIDLREVMKKNENDLLLRKDDELVISSIFDLRDDYTVHIDGAIRKPGDYPYSDSITLKDLILMGGGLNEDAFLSRALLTRFNNDKSKERITISLDSILNNLLPDIVLKRKDDINIYSQDYLRYKPTVSIYGEVRKSGEQYEYSKNLTLKDLILLSGGLTENALLTNIEIARKRDIVDPNKKDEIISDIINVSLDTSAAMSKKQEIILQPYDIVTIKSNPYKTQQQTVSVSGQVFYPGSYALISKDERLSSVIKRAGGILITGNISGARLRRLKQVQEDDRLLIDKISKIQKDSTGTLIQSLDYKYEDIAINLSAAINNPQSQQDIFLREGDELIVPVYDEMVRVNGEVLHPIKISYKRPTTRYYINAAGGFVTSANKNKVFVVYQDGKAAKTKKILGLFRKYPKIYPGSTVYIPKYEKVEGNRKSPAEIVATVSAVSTLVYLAIFIANSVK